MSVLFISETQLKRASLIHDNVDMKAITPTVLLMQDMHIHPVLGSSLYNELKDEITAGNVSGSNKTLLDNYIRPPLVWWTMFEAPVALSYQFRNGVRKPGDDNKGPSMEELMKLSERYRNHAEWYTERLRLFLVQNAGTYPLYRNGNPGLDALRPDSSAYETGMCLD